MTEAHKMGVITLIPKGNKDRKLLSNWRPISLLNVIYKIASSCIANRIKQILPFVINESQKGFMSGRFIGENIRLLFDLMLYTDLNDIPGLLLIIDFEKAFDSISHDFIFQALDFFNFGDSIKSWIKLFYENASSCAMVNGHMTNRFNIERGCRQGDPLSPYIFLLCAEILSIMVRKCDGINGIKIANVQHKIIQYADDTLITLDGTEDDLKKTIEILNTFEAASGLSLNKHKTKVMWIGRYKERKDSLCTEENLDWVFDGYFKYLGIDFSGDLHDMVDHNFYTQILHINSQMTLWLKRSLTVFGRIIVVKSLLVSKLNYLFLSLPNPSDEIMKLLQKSFFEFIWNHKPDKISRKQMIQPYHLGGAKMIDIYSHVHSLKISWMRRYFFGNIDSFIDNLMHTFMPKNCQLNPTFGDVHFLRLSIGATNPFWKNVFLAYSILQSKSFRDISCQPLWFNSHIQVNNVCVFYRSWYEKGIICINDLLDEDGTFLSLNEFKLKYQITTIHWPI